MCPHKLQIKPPSKREHQPINQHLKKVTAFSGGASTHVLIYPNTLPFFLVLSQGPISGPRLSVQAFVRGPIGSPRGCERPQGSRRIITLLISQASLHIHKCTHTHTRTTLALTQSCSHSSVSGFLPAQNGRTSSRLFYCADTLGSTRFVQCG